MFVVGFERSLSDPRRNDMMSLIVQLIRKLTPEFFMFDSGGEVSIHGLGRYNNKCRNTTCDIVFVFFSL
jgi:hypothetical protein